MTATGKPAVCDGVAQLLAEHPSARVPLYSHQGRHSAFDHQVVDERTFVPLVASQPSQRLAQHVQVQMAEGPADVAAATHTMRLGHVLR